MEGWEEDFRTRALWRVRVLNVREGVKFGGRGVGVSCSWEEEGCWEGFARVWSIL